VQWQVSSHGGVTYSHIAGATSTTLTFGTSLSENGYLYRAVFTNSVAPPMTHEHRSGPQRNDRENRRDIPARAYLRI
jgi:hypothetical protein